MCSATVRSAFVYALAFVAFSIVSRGQVVYVKISYTIATFNDNLSLITLRRPVRYECLVLTPVSDCYQVWTSRLQTADRSCIYISWLQVLDVKNDVSVVTFPQRSGPMESL